MEALRKRIEAEAVHVGGGFIKVDSFLNHQVDPALMMLIGMEFARRFVRMGLPRPTKVLTAAVSGIAPAFAAAWSYKVFLLFARKTQNVVMSDHIWLAQAPSRTSQKGDMITLMVSSEYLGGRDRVYIIDDFLASGGTINALAEIVRKSGAALVGIGCVIEKIYERGRERLESLGVPVVSLARVDIDDAEPGGIKVLREELE